MQRFILFTSMQYCDETSDQHTTNTRATITNTVEIFLINGHSTSDGGCYVEGFHSLYPLVQRFHCLTFFAAMTLVVSLAIKKVVQS